MPHWRFQSFDLKRESMLSFHGSIPYGVKKGLKWKIKPKSRGLGGHVKKYYNNSLLMNLHRVSFVNITSDFYQYYHIMIKLVQIHNYITNRKGLTCTYIVGIDSSKYNFENVIRAFLFSSYPFEKTISYEK